MPKTQPRSQQITQNISKLKINKIYKILLAADAPKATKTVRVRSR